MKVRTKNSLYLIEAKQDLVTVRKIEDNYRGGHPNVPLDCTLQGKLDGRLEVGRPMVVACTDGRIFQSSQVMEIQD